MREIGSRSDAQNRGRRWGRAAALALLAAAATLLASCGENGGPTFPDMPAYDPTIVLNDTSVIYHWPLGTTIHLYVDSAMQPAGADLAAAVAHGAQLWSGVIANGEFRFQVVATPQDADVIVHYRDEVRLVILPSGCPDAIAGGLTVICTQGHMVLALAFRSLPGTSHVRMDVYVDSYTFVHDGEAAFLSLVAHELGHVIGIGRGSTNAADLMYVAPTVAAPSAADVQTLLYVLHHPSSLTF